MEDLSKILNLKEEELNNIIDETMSLKNNSYSPYSKFRVSSIVFTKSKKTYKGVNIENLSYGLSNCAERSAIFNAVSNGDKEFDFIIVGSDLDTFLTPCGACRQVIQEFGINNVVLINNKKETKLVSMDYLLPTSPEIPGLKK